MSNNKITEMGDPGSRGGDSGMGNLHQYEQLGSETTGDMRRISGISNNSLLSFVWGKIKNVIFLPFITVWRMITGLYSVNKSDNKSVNKSDNKSDNKSVNKLESDTTITSDTMSRGSNDSISKKKGPADINEILSGLRSDTLNNNKGHIVVSDAIKKSDAIQRSDSIISISSLNDLESEDQELPKRGRRANSDKNTISLDI